MTKVRINNLPEGFTIENGKVKKVMKEGGSTGDQVGYSLKTFVPTSNGGQDRGADNANVRYSLTRVPREVANIEAEGGETVLTDLSGMGAFGLYDINGPRHSSGGVPMYLPEDSFIFSDTNDMKFDRNELKEFDIKSRKKQTPAKVSKKFGLNRYYAEIEDPFADDIQVGSAEIMLDKNKRNLSKLAFMQEAKKNFKEGVPRTAYPYLMSRGINPEQFEERAQRSNLFRNGGSVDLPMAQEGNQGRSIYTGGKTKAGSTTPTGLSNAFKDGRFDLETFYKAWENKIPGIRNMSNQEAQRATYKWSLENQPELVKDMWNRYGLTAEGKKYEDLTSQYKDGIIGEDLTPEQMQNLEKAFVDGMFGARQMLPLVTQATPIMEQEERPESLPDEKMYPGNFNEYTSKTKPEFWQQDAVKMGALAARKRDLRLPWQKPMENTEVGYILEDPTRAIGAINEQMSINNEALKSFSGPQALNARMAQSTAKAAEAIANTVAGVNQRNVQTVNRGLGAQAYYDMMGERENARRLADTYDKTQLALENYQNERNFDREQFADAYASALTNRAKTYNLNMLSDYYDIQPGTGGLIKQTGYKEITPNKNSTQSAEDSFFNFAKRANELGITDPTEAYQSIYGKTGTKSKKKEELEMLQKGKKGKELRRYATPFYSGKIGY